VFSSLLPFLSWDPLLGGEKRWVLLDVLIICVCVGGVASKKWNIFKYAGIFIFHYEHDAIKVHPLNKILKSSAREQ